MSLVTKVQPMRNTAVQPMRNTALHSTTLSDLPARYLMAYASHSLKDIFNVHALDLRGVAKAFGFEHPPRVQLNFNAAKGAKEARERKRQRVGTNKTKDGRFIRGSGTFSAGNPHGKRGAGDQRQFGY